MVIISTMTIMELSIAVVGILGAIGGVIKASNCKKVSLCKVIECERSKTDDNKTETPVVDENNVSRNSSSSSLEGDFDKALRGKTTTESKLLK